MKCFRLCLLNMALLTPLLWADPAVSCQWRHFCLTCARHRACTQSFFCHPPPNQSQPTYYVLFSVDTDSGRVYEGDFTSYAAALARYWELKKADPTVEMWAFFD